MCKRITQMPTNSLRKMRELKTEGTKLRAKSDQATHGRKYWKEREVKRQQKKTDCATIELCTSIDNINIVTFREIHILDRANTVERRDEKIERKKYR